MYQHDQSAVRRTRRALVNVTALLILGAAAIHFAVVPEHLEEYLPFGLFFIVVGTVQAAVATAVILRPSRRLFLAALALSVGLAGLWLLSRTAGLPIGPHPGRPEGVGIPDLICTALEVVSALVLLVLVVRSPTWGRPCAQRGRNAGSMPRGSTTSVAPMPPISSALKTAVSRQGSSHRSARTPACGPDR
jgi:hypothetical protein